MDFAQIALLEHLLFIFASASVLRKSRCFEAKCTFNFYEVLFMKVSIETAINGWLIRKEPDDIDDRIELSVHEHPERCDEVGEVKAFAGVLMRLTELLCPTTSRYSAARIYVEVRPGDKYME